MSEWNVLPLGTPQPPREKWSTAIVVSAVILALAWLVPLFGAVVKFAAVVWLCVGLVVMAWLLVRLIMQWMGDGHVAL